MRVLRVGWKEEEEEAQFTTSWIFEQPCVSLHGVFCGFAAGVGWQAFWEKQSEGAFLGGFWFLFAFVLFKSKLYPRFLELAGVFFFNSLIVFQIMPCFLKSSFLFALRIDAQFRRPMLACITIAVFPQVIPSRRTKSSPIPSPLSS